LFLTIEEFPMRIDIRKVATGLILGGLTLAAVGTDASAATARHYYNKGHGYRGYGRHYGNPAVGRAVAGAALGIIGAAAGAAIANRYDDGYGYGYPYGGQGYVYGGYPPAPYTYGGYGYGYEPY
jgi:hypothetical protein